jgi:hypothetical protein
MKQGCRQWCMSAIALHPHTCSMFRSFCAAEIPTSVMTMFMPGMTMSGCKVVCTASHQGRRRLLNSAECLYACILGLHFAPFSAILL